MKLIEAIEHRKQELLSEYKEVAYRGYEIVNMTSNTTTSNYINEKISIEETEVKLIKNRFKEIEEEIKAVKVMFDVKYPRQRKHRYHEEYFRIIN